jgi:solute:Na+ symporter, SSS family
LSLHLVTLLVYSALLVAMGAALSRRVRTAGDFFVAGRRLGPGLLFATMLAANIGAGSTVGATALGYRAGLSAWWWVGSAAVGSLVLAAVIGPRIRREAERLGLRTVGDYLEARFDRRVRATSTALLWVATLFILAGQLNGVARILGEITRVPHYAGAILGGMVIGAYFIAGGLQTSVSVHVVQLTVKMAGFALVLPLAIAGAGGWDTVEAAAPQDPSYWDPWQRGPPGWVYLALLVPPFFVSPGLLQKVYGARDDRAVRIGVGLNALGLLAFAFVPALLGIVARVQHPDLPSPDSALPRLLVADVPPLVGAIGLAALFSAEVSAADAVLFMLSTSLSQDLYKRFLNPAASDDRMLFVARGAAAAGAVAGVSLAIVLPSVILSLTIFYSLMGVALFVPIVAGLCTTRADATTALAGIAAGIATLLLTHVATGGTGVAWATPTFAGLLVGCVAAIAVGIRNGTRK